MLNKKILIVFIFLIIILFTGIGIYWFNYLPKNTGYQNQNIKMICSTCLDNNEIVSHSAPGKNQEQQKANQGYFATSPVMIFIKDKETNKEKREFQIENNSKGFYTLQLFKCNIYVTRIFNFDEEKGKPLPNYRTELWRYNYNNEGEKLLILFKRERDPDNYGQSFRISTDEKYIILEKGYFGKEDYSLVIKDLGTKEDIFILSMKNIAEQYPNITGSFGLDQWTEDSRYFWGDIFDGTYVNGYFRIDTQNWETDIYEAPDGAMGGSPLNINTGYLPIQPGQVWTGDYQLTEELKEQDRKEGKKSELYLYNLFTKKKILVETTDEPLFWFKSRWFSDTELEYELPNGEKRVYQIKQ